ncbi:MAG: hypothetical protein LBE31_09715 [Deltaproteobacteria bacterium]|nr:hypothetical protein [Deltaproteobacteria bacterium]
MKTNPPSDSKQSAILEVEKLLALNQSDPDLWAELASLLLGSANSNQARSYLQKALLLNPSHLRANDLLKSLEAAPKGDSPPSGARSEPKSGSPNSAQNSPQSGSQNIPQPSSQLGARAKNAPEPSGQVEPINLLWCLSPDKDDEVASLLGFIAKMAKVTRVVSLNFDAYYRALVSSKEPVIIEGSSPSIERVFAESGLFSGRKVIWRLGLEDILNEPWVNYDLSLVTDVVVESPTLRGILIDRLKARQKNLTPGTRLHTLRRPVNFSLLSPNLATSSATNLTSTSASTSAPTSASTSALDISSSKDKPKMPAILAAPGPHGPWSGLMEVMAAYSLLFERDDRTELHLSGPLGGAAFELALAYYLTGKPFASKVFITREKVKLGSFLLGKTHYLACPLVAGGPGLVEALYLGLIPLVKDAPGLADLMDINLAWRTFGQLLDRFETLKSFEETKALEDNKTFVKNTFSPDIFVQSLLSILRSS